MIAIPPKVDYILGKLGEHGFQAYAVGGCVRDAILGREPEDWDITTSATPAQVKEIFKRTVDTGIAHGTVTVMLDKEGYEVTTYRIDGEYEDNRHPKRVEFTPNLIEDLARRDFTINAMAYNSREGLIDQFNGLEDLKNQVVRCVGAPCDRFDEDALRILRAVRFSAQLGFEIEEETRVAIIKKVKHLKNISAERIRVELDKLLVSNYPDRIVDAFTLGITGVVLPEFDRMMETAQTNPHHYLNVGYHTLKAIENITREEILLDENQYPVEEQDKFFHVLRWTMLLHDVAKPDTRSVSEDGMDHFHGHQEKSSQMAKQILRRLKFDNHTIDLVVRLIRWHDVPFTLTPAGIRRQIHKIGEDVMPLLFYVRQADILAQSPERREDKMDILMQAKGLYQTVLLNRDCVGLKTLAVNGGDLIRIGFRPGRAIGEALESLLTEVIEDPALNDKEILLSKAEHMNKVYIEKDE